MYQKVRAMAILQKIRGFALPSDPKTKLQHLLNISAIIVGYFYVWTFQDFLRIQVAFIDLTTLLRLPIITLIIFPLVKYGYIKQDWLQRGRPKLKSVRFFQLQFPSLYIKERCNRCVEAPQTCKNYISPESRDHTSFWLNKIFPIIKSRQEEDAARTFEKGYTCKLIFGLEVVLLFFVIVSVLTAAWKPVLDLILHKPLVVSVGPLQIIFVLVCLGITGLLRTLHSPDLKSPTGCWHAWREVNDALKLWMRTNDPTLVDLVCHAGSNNKSFVQK
jgi:hypothetical protein